MIDGGTSGAAPGLANSPNAVNVLIDSASFPSSVEVHGIAAWRGILCLNKGPLVSDGSWEVEICCQQGCARVLTSGGSTTGRPDEDVSCSPSEERFL